MALVMSVIDLQWIWILLVFAQPDISLMSVTVEWLVVLQSSDLCAVAGLFQ